MSSKQTHQQLQHARQLGARRLLAGPSTEVAADYTLPSQRSVSPRAPIAMLDSEDGAWLAAAVSAVERAINALVDAFIQDPYMHRVEHCLHVELVTLLKRQPELAAVIPLSTGQRTQLVHKEWPETHPRPAKRGRGSFDIAVLAPGQTRRSDIRTFLDGYIAAPIVIELGLNYPLRHLNGDIEKLDNSHVRHPYLVHFSHATPTRPLLVEQALESLHAPFRTAYAHADPGSLTVIAKHLNASRPEAAGDSPAAEVGGA